MNWKILALTSAVKLASIPLTIYILERVMNEADRKAAQARQDVDVLSQNH